MKIDLEKLSIKSAHNHLMKGDFTAEELAKNVLENVAAKNPEINAYLEVFDDVETVAQRAQEAIDDGKAGALTGIPLAIKDNILIEGKKSSAASKIIENYTAAYSATVIKRLAAEGSVFVGRTNMDEFAMGSSTENSAFGPTKNPFDTTRVAGGSSGGSAAAVAMGGALGALGSDTAGSIRQPASFCGLVGLKTTYGSVSRHGLIALGSSLDQIGPIAKTVSDAEIIFNCIRGADPMDSTTIPEEQYMAAREQDASHIGNSTAGKAGSKAGKAGKAGKTGKKLTIGVPRSLIEVPGIDADVLENFKQSVARFKKLGYEIEEIELSNVSYSLAAYYILLPGEASSNLARFDGVKYGLKVAGEKLLDDYHKTRGEGFGEEPRRRILLGTYVLSSGYYDAYYNKAQAVRRLIADDFHNAFASVDAIILPTTPTPAFKLGEKTADPVAMYLADIFTAPANIANMPTISMPSGFVERDANSVARAGSAGKSEAANLVRKSAVGEASDKVSLPLGLQIMAPLCREDILFRLGKEFLGE